MLGFDDMYGGSCIYPDCMPMPLGCMPFGTGQSLASDYNPVKAYLRGQSYVGFVFDDGYSIPDPDNENKELIELAGNECSNLNSVDQTVVAACDPITFTAATPRFKFYKPTGTKVFPIHTGSRPIKLPNEQDILPPVDGPIDVDEVAFSMDSYLTDGWAQMYCTQAIAKVVGGILANVEVYDGDLEVWTAADDAVEVPGGINFHFTPDIAPASLAAFRIKEPIGDDPLTVVVLPSEDYFHLELPLLCTAMV